MTVVFLTSLWETPGGGLQQWYFLSSIVPCGHEWAGLICISRGQVHLEYCLHSDDPALLQYYPMNSPGTQWENKQEWENGRHSCWPTPLGMCRNVSRQHSSCISYSPGTVTLISVFSACTALRCFLLPFGSVVSGGWCSAWARVTSGAVIKDLHHGFNGQWQHLCY